MLRKLFTNRPKTTHHDSVRDLIRREAYVGSSLFGYVGPNRQREFFMLDRYTWIWHEDWTDANGKHSVTTRYEFHNEYVLKIQNSAHPEMVGEAELENLYQAIKSYYYNVASKVYNRPVVQE